MTVHLPTISVQAHAGIDHRVQDIGDEAGKHHCSATEECKAHSRWHVCLQNGSHGPTTQPVEAKEDLYHDHACDQQGSDNATGRYQGQ